MNERDTLKINAKGTLEIGGMDTVEIAKKFSTPVYVYDEQHIRNMMRLYKDTINEYYGGNGLVLYASKAFSCKAIYRIAQQENIGIDAVSGGELYTAINAGFNPSKICLHGNNKLKHELELALDNGVGIIVVDSHSEVDLLDQLASSRSIKQDVLIRVNPGIEAHTHAFVQTARTDSKFGFSIHDGTAEKMVLHLMNKRNLILKGFHCHIGSQIFEKEPFVLATEKMIAFIADLKTKYGFETNTLNMGGGFGIWYTDEDSKLSFDDYREYLRSIIDVINNKTEKLHLKKPYLLIEPGRSIVGEAGITLYTVGAIKDIEGIKKYVAVDGGMFESPRYALYQSKYTAILANRANEPCTEKVTIAGKCCESGDIIAADVALPLAKSGDIIAVFSTGAYHYSMASNYNRNFIPPVVLVGNGTAEYIVKPQSYEDIVRNDAVPERLKWKQN